MEERGTSRKRPVGRRPAEDPAKHRHSIKLTSAENAEFERQFALSGLNNRAAFIKAAVFSRQLKVLKIDPATNDFYIRLTNFYAQFSAIGNNYNQTVRALKSNFGEKRALSMLYRLEKTTAELSALCRHIIELIREYERKYLSDDSQDQ